MKTSLAKFSAIRMDKGQKRGEEKIAIVALLVFILVIWIFRGGGGGNVFKSPTRLLYIVV